MPDRDQWRLFAMLLNAAANKYKEGDPIWAALNSVSITAEGISDMLILDEMEQKKVTK